MEVCSSIAAQSLSKSLAFLSERKADQRIKNSLIHNFDDKDRIAFVLGKTTWSFKFIIRFHSDNPITIGLEQACVKNSLGKIVTEEP